MSKKQIGMKVDGVFFRKDGSDITWDNFIERIEREGLEYTGKTSPIDDEGNEYELEDVNSWKLGEIIEEEVDVKAELLKEAKKETKRVEKLLKISEERRNIAQQDNRVLTSDNERLRENINTLNESLDISQRLHEKEFVKNRRFEKALYALLNVVSEQEQDGLVDIITDTLNGHDLMDQYEDDVVKGKEIFIKEYKD